MYQFLTLCLGPSFPRDTDAPSFLTTLPAELRLEIYEILFLRDKPVLIKPRPSWFHNTKFLDPSEVCSDVPSDEFQYDEWSEVSSVAQDDEDSCPSPEKLSRTPSGVDSAFGLLGSCRQIYTESIATLYSKNTFILSLTRSEFLTRRIDITVQWMLTLGSTISLLRHVHIRACKFDYDGDVSLCSIDIARLARFMWRNPTKELHVSFGPHPKVSKGPLAAVYRCECSERMDNVLTALVKNDTLDIKRYTRFETLVSGIFIDNCVKSGRIHYPYHTYPGHQNPDQHVIDDSDGGSNEPIEFALHGVYRKFDVSDEGCHIFWRETHSRPNLSNLPSRATVPIIKYAILSEDGTSFNLDCKTSSGFQAGLLGIDSRFRGLALYEWSSTNTITLKISTDQIHTDFSNFAALRHWNREPVSKLLTKGQWTFDKQHRIVLEFHLDGASTLSMLRIKMLRFLQLTLRMRSNVQVVFAVTHVNTGEDNIESHVVTLEQLRENVFVLLSKFCDTQNLDLDMPHLDIEFDGRGSPVQICHPEGMSQSGQPYLLVNPSIHQQEMKEYARNYRDAWKNANYGVRYHYRAPKQAELRRMWLRLKDVIRYY